MPSSGYIKMLDTVMTGCVMRLSGLSLRIFAGILKATLFEKNWGQSTSFQLKKNFQHFQPDYSQFLNDHECCCCIFSCITLRPCKVDTLSLTTYIRNSAVWVPICASLHLFLLHQNTVGSTHSPYIAVGIKG
jgi:hypothetical protein